MVKAAKENAKTNKDEPLEKQLWKAADKLRKNIDAAEYKHVVMGLIFLKYISDSFEEMFAKLNADKKSGADPEDKDEYKAENIFFVPSEARWSFLVAKAKLPTIGTVVDEAMDAIEKENPSLKGVLPKVFARQNLDPASLGGLIDLVGNIALGDAKSRSADVLVVSMSRRIAAELYKEIVALKPEWHSNDLNKGAIKVVMTAASSDGPLLAKHHTTKEQRKQLAERMKNDGDPLKLVIVRDMWLTGFDAPSMHTLYIDKPMKGHNLMQAIARVNRVHKDKPGGLVVDYLGIAADLKEALSFYSDAGGKGDPALAQEQAVSLMLEKLEVVSAMYHGFAYENYFEAETAQKLSLILAAEEHILGLEDGRKRYINEVTVLSLAFAIAVPHEQAMDARDEVGFFQAVKARLAKFDSTGEGRSNEEIETTIRQVIDKALVSEKVIDIFDAGGIKKPDISVLSDEFLAELKGYKHKNIALEVLKKLLNEELKARAKKNLVQSKTLMEMLEIAIKKYHNKILTAAEVTEELIKISKEIVASDDEAKHMGLSDFEYAFYTAVTNNNSARELMQQDKLRELAVVLTQKIRETASIDWTIKESVRAKLKVAVKRILRQYGYPPDMQLLATETVLKQAEMIANELAVI